MLLALAGHASAFTPPTTLRGRLKDALVNNEPLRTALNGAREPELLPLLGPSLAPRVSDLLRAEAPPPAYPIGAFEERAGGSSPGGAEGARARLEGERGHSGGAPAGRSASPRV